MGLFRSRPTALAALTAKVTDLADAVKAVQPQTIDLVPLAQALTASARGEQSGAFLPGLPIPPTMLDPRNPITGLVDPRRNEYPIGVNLNIRDRTIPFQVLRDAADRVDVMRRCIEVRKAHMQALDWDITLSKRALRRIMITDGIASPGKAAQVARERFEPEMIRLREWWEKPDRLNQMDWTDWLGVLLEEQMVVDAATIYPRRRLSGEVASFEVIDGSTIKPLWDRRGSTPLPPAPAFQQILYGAPRGEWVASTDGVSDEWTAAQLVYRPRYRRSFTPYGYPEVEQALSSVDLYLKAIGWIRSEFDDGTVPDQWMKTDIKIGTQAGALTAAQLAEYEAVMNASLAGNTVERHALHLLPAGFEPVQMLTFVEKFSPDLFEMLIKLICMCFHVMPTEVGFPPSSGIGGKGHQEGEANSAWRKEIRPSVRWLQGLMTDLSREFLGMPAELEFSFLGFEVEDQAEAEKVTDSATRGGRSTVNEARGERGLPLFDFPAADKPFIVTGAGLVFLEGSDVTQVAVQPPAPADGAPTVTVDPAAGDGVPDEVGVDDGVPEEGEYLPEGEPVPDGFLRVNGYLRRKPTAAVAAAVDEITKFVTFAERRAQRSWRDFTFEHHGPQSAAALNRLGAAGDLEALKTLAAELRRAATTEETPT